MADKKIGYWYYKNSSITHFKVNTVNALKEAFARICDDTERSFLHQRINSNSFFTYCHNCDEFKIHINGFESASHNSNCDQAIREKVSPQQKKEHSSTIVALTLEINNQDTATQ